MTVIGWDHDNQFQLKNQAQIHTENVRGHPARTSTSAVLL